MILFADTETTGLPRFDRHGDHPAQPWMVSIAAVLSTRDGDDIAAMHRLIRPDGWTIPAELVAIHGITTERCAAEGMALAEVMAEFGALQRQAELVVCYGIGFDMKIISGGYRRARLDDLTKTSRTWCAQAAAAKVCRMPATEKMIAAGRGNQFKTPKLAEAYEIVIGEKMEGAHDALADVRALKRIVFRLRQIQRDKGVAA